MDPIIKTVRISPSTFSLNLHQPNSGQQFKATEPPVDKAKTQRSAGDAIANKATPLSVGQESVLTPAAIEKLVPRIAIPPDLYEDAEARIEAEQKEKIREAFSKAQDEGYSAGFLKGEEKAKQELNTSLKQISELFHSLKDLDELLFQEMENSAVEVVFEAITKIIGNAATDKKLAYNITREAIEQVKAREKIIVRVSVQDYEMIKDALKQDETGELVTKNISVIADNIVQLGGCMIETEAGNLDARLEIQLQRLKDTLLGVRKSNADA